MTDELPTAVGPRLETADEPASFVLVVVEGPEAGRTFDLAPRAFVGKSESCDIRLGDPEISRRHIVLDSTDGRLRLTDLGSTNGTVVGGVAVLDAYLGEGQEVRIGSTRFRVDRRSGGEPQRPPAPGFGKLIGGSPAMQRIYPVCERLAAHNVLVLIEGETGTGKEVLAEALHEQGPRAAGPFVVFDCTAVPPNLVESELFGHERGSFTGAMSLRKGLFEQAHGGTLLIDEIGDLDPALQPKLLRAIERGEVRRLGGAQPIKVDVRILAATRRDLDREVQAGRFRDDLFHRLAVARIELPPLRRRKGDVDKLAQHFFAQLGGAGSVSTALLARWRDYPWPGNVRELRNAVARQIVLGDLADQPVEADLPAKASDVVDQVLAMRLPLTLARQKVIADFERRYVERVLEEHGGNVVRAAQASGIARRYLQKLKARQGK